MRLSPPAGFIHAGNVRGAFRDPRQAGFDVDRVEIDLRECEFIRPAAVLWCLVYPILTRVQNSESIVLVPDNVGVTIYLKSLGFFELLHRHGVEADDRDIRWRQDPRVILPITQITTQSEVEDLANRVIHRLSQARLGAANLYSLVSETFAELALNAVEHAESPVHAFGFIQFYEFAKGHRFVCAVADGGMGIRKSLEKNPDFAGTFYYDHDAIERAMEERVSGTGSKTRGIGLYGVAEDMRLPGRELIVHSGKGSVRIASGQQSRARRTGLFPGTLVFASIPT